MISPAHILLTVPVGTRHVAKEGQHKAVDKTLV